MISHEHKCIFIHLPRTAGTSVEIALTGADGFELGREKHWSALEAREKYRKHWDSYFKFSIIRNPWERLVSYYKFFQYACPFGTFIKNCPKPRGTRRAMRELDYPWEVIHGPDWMTSCSQVDRLSDREGVLLVDYIVQFEDLEWGVINALGSVFDLTHAVPTEATKHFTEYYTTELVDIVAERCKKDIDLFGYVFEKVDEAA